MKIEVLHFADIKAIWSNNLWPQRKSLIEEVSYIDHNGDIDMRIRNWAAPVFLGSRLNDRIVAVTSFYQTNAEYWRLRGTWIHEDLRGHKMGKRLITEVVQFVKNRQHNGRIWTMARESSVQFYLKNQFEIRQKIVGYEFGPHVMMIRESL